MLKKNVKFVIMKLIPGHLKEDKDSCLPSKPIKLHNTCVAGVVF